MRVLRCDGCRKDIGGGLFHGWYELAYHPAAPKPRDPEMLHFCSKACILAFFERQPSDLMRKHYD